MSPLSHNHWHELWREAIPGDNYLPAQLANLEEAPQGLHALSLLLDNNHTESMEEDESQSYALGDHITGPLHSAASALSLYAYDHLTGIREHCKKRNAEK